MGQDISIPVEIPIIGGKICNTNVTQTTSESYDKDDKQVKSKPSSDKSAGSRASVERRDTSGTKKEDAGTRKTDMEGDTGGEAKNETVTRRSSNVSEKSKRSSSRGKSPGRNRPPRPSNSNRRPLPLSETRRCGIKPSNSDTSEAPNRVGVDVRDRYEMDESEILGKGNYGVVYRGREIKTGVMYAIKSIEKSKLKNLAFVRREIAILKEVDHPNIIKLHEVFEDDHKLHLVMELCTGGELFDRIVAKTQSPEGHFSEYDAAEIVRSILKAIQYCHDELHICHRDLKPKNFLFLTNDEKSEIKIIDFGLSRHESMDTGGVMRTMVGTPHYVAPEVLRGSYTKSCDMWSIGIITFILLCGYPPFCGDNARQIFDSVLSAKFDFPSPDWDPISDNAKEFITNLLGEDPSLR
mmetsp:Transcript_9261/g.20476  ORF Transcript_9261/g.20476 Transcript_9261/m.20476 type:complete len:409 (+) Transcript_9261:348-1574(+)